MSSAGTGGTAPRSSVRWDARGLTFHFPSNSPNFRDVNIALPWDEVVAVAAHRFTHPQTGREVAVLTFYGNGRAVEADENVDGWPELLDVLPLRLPLDVPDWQARVGSVNPRGPHLLVFRRTPELPEWVRVFMGLDSGPDV